ncbi:hypothetical protein MKX01_032513 [Papaver californicum]|nr:hypothetical protein MKX01_032513 [Papaver californicum]
MDLLQPVLLLLLGAMLLDFHYDLELFFLLVLQEHICFTVTSDLQDIRNWIRNIEQHASDNVNKFLLATRLIWMKAVPTAEGQALADEYGIKFFETSAKTNLNVEQVFFSVARDIKERLSETDTRPEPSTVRINPTDQPEAAPKSACCGS